MEDKGDLNFDEDMNVCSIVLNFSAHNLARHGMEHYSEAEAGVLQVQGQAGLHIKSQCSLDFKAVSSVRTKEAKYFPISAKHLLPGKLKFVFSE